jgi:hypothetical protein
VVRRFQETRPSLSVGRVAVHQRKMAALAALVGSNGRPGCGGRLRRSGSTHSAALFDFIDISLSIGHLVKELLTMIFINEWSTI